MLINATENGRMGRYGGWGMGGGRWGWGYKVLNRDKASLKELLEGGETRLRRKRWGRWR